MLASGKANPAIRSFPGKSTGLTINGRISRYGVFISRQPRTLSASEPVVGVRRLSPVGRLVINKTEGTKMTSVNAALRKGSSFRLNLRSVRTRQTVIGRWSFGPVAACRLTGRGLPELHHQLNNALFEQHGVHRACTLELLMLLTAQRQGNLMTVKLADTVSV